MAQQNEEVVRRAVQTTPSDLHLDVWHPDVRIDNMPEFPIQGPYHGHDGVRQWAEDTSDVIDAFRTEVESIVDVGNGRVMALLQSYGKAAHTGIDIAVPWATICTLQDGLVIHAQGYWTHDEALTAAGIRE